MRKTHLILLSLLLFCGAGASSHLWGHSYVISHANGPEEIDLILFGMPTSTKKPKNVVTPPIRAWYDDTFSTITLVFNEPVGFLTVSISDENDVIKVQEVVDGDAGQATIYLPSLPEGYYFITITEVRPNPVSFGGWFVI